ncbi:MAG: hypothetical protein U1E27_07390, partial [Kiritimatiellia bacterium]|nr:hypothetical protein [Kiritimatiellia bacterium]
MNNSLYNGYMLRYVKTDTPIPDSVLIKKADGTYWNGPAELSFDPAYIYRKGPLWVERLNHLLAQIRDWGGEDLVANWEPYMYSREHGSFTEASMRDFAAHLEVSYDAIKDMAPATILAHYEKELLAFRSWQHGQVVKTIMECLADFNEPNRTSIRFIPWLGTEAITYDYEDPRIRTSQLSCHGSHTVEYLDVASSWHYTHIDYFEYADKRELYDLGLRRGDVAPLDRMDYSPNFYRTERRVAWVTQTRALKGRGPIPYYHLTQNNHLTSKVVLPDEIEHQILASFAAGASGVNMYYFPMGYDSRYWHSAARAFNRIATYEDFVLKGEKVDVCTVTPLSKTYRNDALAERSGIEGEAYSYAARAYSLDGRLLIALCNFSLRDDVVLHVAISGEPSGKVALHDPHQGTHYSYLGQAYLPAEKWQSGIVFRLPKKTIQFYVVESHDPQSTYGRALDLAQSEKKATESIRELNRVFDQRENRLKALLEGASASAVFNAEDVEPFSEGEISAQMIALDGAPVYQVKTSVQEIRIDPSDGAVIRSWRSGSDDLVLRRDTEGGFCRDRFWLPAGCANLAELSGMYRFARHALEGQEWKVTFTQTIHHPAMRNFMMEKT